MGFSAAAGCVGLGRGVFLATGNVSANLLDAREGVASDESSGDSGMGDTACVDTSRASITGPPKPVIDSGATCTSAITAACNPNETHTAASGRCTRGGIVGSSKEAFTDIDAPKRNRALQSVYAPMHSHMYPDAF